MNQTKGKNNIRIFIPKIDLPAVLAIIFFVGLIFLYLIPGFEKAMMDRKRNLIHEMSSSVYSLLEYYHSLETSDSLKTSEAKELAKSAISSIRYGETQKDYFWITDTFPRMIAHPYRPDLNGTDLTEFRDSMGKYIFVEFVKAVSDNGESYVDYMWQWNDDSTRVVSKLSYVRLYQPWGWVIGTGIYVEDVRAEIRKMEYRALLISAIILLVVMVLLFAGSRQSHRIEQKRKQAENALHKSRELYRTLAEASSEGVMIWSHQGLQANKTLLSWLEYSEEEVYTMSLTELFSSPEITLLDNPDILYEELSTRRYVEGLLRTRTGTMLKTHADFSKILLGNLTAVLIVLRPVKKLTPQTESQYSMPLLNNISTGFFSLSYGKKNRFIFASKPALDILGFHDLHELSQLSIDSLFVNSYQLKEFTHSLSLKESAVGKVVLLRKKNGNEFPALINVIVIESGSGEIWCEGTIEPLAASAYLPDTPVTDIDIFGASFMLNAPVSSIMRSPVECRENISVGRALTIMSENDSHVLIIVNREGEPLGVLDSAMIGFSLIEGTSLETEVFRLMNSPPVFIESDSPVYEAFKMIRNNAGRSIIVISGTNKLLGLISTDELTRSFFLAHQLLSSGIERSVSPSALRKIFISSQNLAVSMILGHADPYSITLFISSIADTICKRIITLSIEEEGTPPCRFAFIQTGSAGRKEQSLSTDQDNAIIFEDLEGENLKKAEEYFTALGKRINNMLAETGFRLCKGENMAGNPAWCQSLSRWKKYFSGWINAPGPQELLEVSIFFDFRHCYGDQAVSDELRNFVETGLQTNDIYFHHMSAAWKQFAPAQGVLSAEKTDIKRLIMPLTGLVRLYALKYKISGLSTPDRIIGLYSGQHIDNNILRKTLKAWKDLTAIRLSHQASCILKGTEPDNMVDFNISDYNLSLLAGQAIESINVLMLKSSNDFYTDQG